MRVPATGPLILLVDDFDDAREMYSEYLEFCGFRVETARDGREALEKARTLTPDLVLMDLSLPVLDGWEATRILKADPATRHIVVVALSAHTLNVDSARARAAGCDGFIAKPCLPPDLVTKISTFLKPRAHATEGHPGTRQQS